MVYLNSFIYVRCVCAAKCGMCFFQPYFTVSLFRQAESESRPLEGLFSVYSSVLTLLAPFTQFEDAGWERLVNM